MIINKQTTQPQNGGKKVDLNECIIKLWVNIENVRLEFMLPTTELLPCVSCLCM